MSGAGITGIDVSKWQGDIDFTAVAAAGHAFVYCRAGYGTGADSRIGDNWPKAKAAGLLRGAYHYLVAGEDGEAQAQAFLKVFEGAGLGYGPGDLPPAADVEDRNALASDDATARYLDALRTWVATVGKALDTAPVIYTGTWFWRALGNPAGFETCPLWLARYGEEPGALPPGWSDWTFWQHSGDGGCAGIAGAVDLDCFNGDRAALAVLAIGARGT